MDRREFLKVAGASAIWLSLAGCGDGLSSSGRKPNIVLIMADDLGYETLGAYGGTSYATPVLDDLAANSLRFDHAYSQPICTASRVKIMTGLYNHRNYEAFGILPPGQTTFAHLLSPRTGDGGPGPKTLASTSTASGRSRGRTRATGIRSS